MGKHLITNRLLEKLIGASFSISIYYIITLIDTNFNLFEFHELITQPAIWMLFFGYGILSSIIIDDGIGRIVPRFNLGKQILFYILFGYLIFLFFLPLGYVLIAGTVGAFFSLLFLLGKKTLKPFKWYSWMVFIVPIVCLVMWPFDFTSKIGWNEVAEDGFVEIDYEFFNGEHLIPVHGKKGEKIYFDVEHTNISGANGMSLYDGNGDYAGMNEEGGDIVSMDFEETTTKYIVVSTVNGRYGQIQVTWWE
ncbi:hypothetical protein MST22_05830 [Virgibacillus halodenitrificans]|uniref:hypothetical protein n=1 Tax=Virgibacillus halodenitrificans TaxID=1482 RepID=UPI001FB2D3A4|nr:hypothetical protein [Virgibacillus halodenitrificans]MCJ0930669.1 hypothetical protein [Virgibacillus halodenitrificans]